MRLLSAVNIAPIEEDEQIGIHKRISLYKMRRNGWRNCATIFEVNALQRWVGRIITLKNWSIHHNNPSTCAALKYWDGAKSRELRDWVEWRVRFSHKDIGVLFRRKVEAWWGWSENDELWGGDEGRREKRGGKGKELENRTTIFLPSLSVTSWKSWYTRHYYARLSQNGNVARNYES